MKIGLLTYHWVPNFGANLQALSTYSYIENKGYEPIILNWIPSDLEEDYKRKVAPKQIEAHRQFAKRHFKNTTPICRDSKDVAHAIEENEIEKVIIGSDAVMTFVPFRRRFHLSKKSIIRYEKPFQDSDVPCVYWGDFINHLSKPIILAGLSVSAQNTRFTSVSNSEKNVLKNCLSSFNYLSVRDIWTQKMIGYMTNNERFPRITPDPVFAFEQNVHGNGYIDKKYNNLEKYVLLSLTRPYYEESWVRELECLFADEGISLIGLPQTNKKFESVLKKNLEFPIDPIDWYLLIKNSCGYIGELMHPVLVSLHNAVPVFVFDRYGFVDKNTFNEASSKTYQIMNRFNLLDNYYNEKQAFKRPSAEMVFNSIMSFNKTSCRNVAEVLLEQYNSMMKDIISL